MSQLNNENTINFIDDMLLLKNKEVDCSEYNNCPKEKNFYNTDFKNTNSFSFLFLGCWGVYCKDGEHILEIYKKKEKEWKQEKVKYGAHSVVKSMTDFTKINGKVNAVILAGDNVYSDTDLTDEDRILIEKGEKSIYNIDKQLDVGFLKCMKNVDTDIFLIGIGNHDIENCYILNKQINFKDWFLPSLSYNIVYNLNNFFVNFIFIDTNIYEKTWCNQDNYPENAHEKQAIWLTHILNQYNNSNTWNIVIGHIPFLANSHIQKEIVRYENLLADLLTKNSNLIDLYMCADEHNQQYINTNPPQVISGSGGAVLDEKIYINDNEYDLKNKTLFSNASFGFVNVSLTIDTIILTYHSSTNSYSPTTFTINKKR